MDSSSPRKSTMLSYPNSTSQTPGRCEGRSCDSCLFHPLRSCAVRDVHFANCAAGNVLRAVLCGLALFGMFCVWCFAELHSRGMSWWVVCVFCRTLPKEKYLRGREIGSRPRIPGDFLGGRGIAPLAPVLTLSGASSGVGRLHLALSRTSWLPQKCRREELEALAKAIGKSRDPAKSEHSLELEQLVSRVASAIHHIGAMLAPEAVERVCWHRVVKRHLPVDTRSCWRLLRKWWNSCLHQNTSGSHAETDGAEALLPEGVTPREDGMWCGFCEICVDKSPRLTSSTSSAVYVSSMLGPAQESAQPSKIHAVALSQA